MGRGLLASRYYSLRAVFASVRALFSFILHCAKTAGPVFTAFTRRDGNQVPWTEVLRALTGWKWCMISLITGVESVEWVCPFVENYLIYGRKWKILMHYDSYFKA